MSFSQHTLHDVLQRICVEVTGKSGKGRRLANSIRDRIKTTSHDHLILESARSLIRNDSFLLPAAKQILKSRVPGIGNLDGIIFNAEQVDKGLVINTNINFLLVNQQYHRFVAPEHSSITNAMILAEILELEKELYFSAKNLSEIASSDLSVKLASLKFSYIFDESNKINNEKNVFSDFIFNDVKSIKEAVNIGSITPKEVVTIIEKATPFKKWLAGIDRNDDLIRKYYDEATKESKLEKLPNKSIRFGIFTGLGAATDIAISGGLGTITGAAIGAFDTFLLDKMIKGWKPNHFIEQDLLPALKKDAKHEA